MINESEVVNLIRLALTPGKQKDILLLARRIARKYKTELPSLSSQLQKICSNSASAEHSVLRNSPHKVIPVDKDTRLNLIREEYPVILDFQPRWEDCIFGELSLFISEREKQSVLLEAGLQPSRSMLFHGLPGTGKTLAARWIANKLNLPLLTLDLSSVMSSFLGRTGVNIRRVLDFAKKTECVLLLDELDAIAKRRDDATEVGELKRLVTVLLQEIDLWPNTGILIAATNHSDLLDPAVWRRFDRTVEFPLPASEDILRLLTHDLDEEVPEKTLSIFSLLLEGQSYSDIAQLINQAKRQAVLQSISLETIFWNQVKNLSQSLPRQERKNIALHLSRNEYTDTQISQWLRMSRDTIRKIRK